MVVRQFPCVLLDQLTVVVVWTSSSSSDQHYTYYIYIKIRRADVDSDNAFHVINDRKCRNVERNLFINRKIICILKWYHCVSCLMSRRSMLESGFESFFITIKWHLINLLLLCSWKIEEMNDRQSEAERIELVTRPTTFAWPSTLTSCWPAKRNMKHVYLSL